jgi:hypothetical protein
MPRNVGIVSIVVNVYIGTHRSPGFQPGFKPDPRLPEYVKRSAGLSGGICRVFLSLFAERHKKLEPFLQLDLFHACDLPAIDNGLR